VSAPRERGNQPPIEPPNPAEARFVPLPTPEDWVRFVLELRQLAEIDRREARDLNLPPGLGGVLLALDSIHTFLGSQKAFHDQADLAALQRLYCALLDLRRGRVSPMFKPVAQKGGQSKGGNPGNGIEVDVVRGLAAKALSELILDGEPPEAAARKVASACGTLHGYGKVTGRLVTGWRAKLQGKPGRGAPKDGAARFAYRAQLAANSNRERADKIIDELRRAVRTMV
jgi:hypothetical protein